MKRRSQSGEATRERLVEAALEVLATDGPAALTTARLARAADIVQSGFYVHFSGVDACLAEATTRIGERLRGLILQGLAELRAVGGGDAGQLARFYGSVLGWLGAERRFIELFLRYRRDPSPPGRALAALLARFHDDVAEHLLLLWGPAGEEANAALRARTATHARLLVGLFLAAVEARLEHPEDSELTLALAHQTVALAEHLFGAPDGPA